MRYFYIILLIFCCNFIYASEVTVIELHNKSIDQAIKDSLLENENEVDEEIIDIENTNLDTDASVEKNNLNEEVLKTDSTSNKQNTDDEIFQTDSNSDIISEIDTETELNEMIKDISSEDLFFLLQNIHLVNSNILKEELSQILDFSTEIVFENVIQEDYYKIIIDSFLKLGNKKKAFNLIQSFEEVKNIEYDNFYKEFKLNYLFSTYNLSEACEYRDEIKEFNSLNNNNFFLKVDIFCLILNEKIDEANLLYSLLEESSINQDEYFQYLFYKLQNLETDENNNNSIINEDNVFLYSAMHRIGNIPLTDEFLEIDPLNLSIPIILSSATNIKLRLKAAHIAYLNKLISIDSLAALYQTVDFSFKELSNPEEILPTFDNDIEIGMAYYYQLINIQLMPKTRLEAVLKFWNFAEQNDFESIAYQISIKNLNTIEPSEEYSNEGANIAKAYTYAKDFQKAEKWLLFAENTNNNENPLHRLNSTKLLFNLNKVSEPQELSEVLFSNLNYMKGDLIDKEHPEYSYKNEILHIIFSNLNENIENPFEIEKKLFENKLMPSIYLINLITEASNDKNLPKLLLSIVVSLKGKEWNDIHPEHFKLIIKGLKEYKDGAIFNTILLEVLQQSHII